MMSDKLSMKDVFNSKVKAIDDHKNKQRFKRLINLNLITEQHSENYCRTIARYINSYTDRCIVIEVKNNLIPPLYVLRANGELNKFWDLYAEWLGIARIEHIIYNYCVENDIERDYTI